MKPLSTFLLVAGLVSASAVSAQTVVHLADFNAPVADGIWSKIGTPTGMAASNVLFGPAAGNGSGGYVLTAGPLPGPDFVGFRYTVSGIDFGTGPVTVSFDGKIQNLIAAATHVRINGNFHGAIMTSFNDSTFTNWSQTYTLSQGFSGTDTLTMDFEFGLGAVNPTGGIWSIDNIRVATTAAIPEPGTWALFGVAGLMGVVALRRRRAA